MNEDCNTTTTNSTFFKRNKLEHTIKEVRVAVVPFTIPAQELCPPRPTSSSSKSSLKPTLFPAIYLAQVVSIPDSGAFVAFARSPWLSLEFKIINVILVESSAKNITKLMLI